jgi:general secretion pathway protein D
MKKILASATKKPKLRLAASAPLAAALLMCGVCGIAAMAPVMAAPADEATFTIPNNDIETVAKAVGHYVGLTFIIDPRVKGQMSLTPEKPITKAQALSLFSSNLRLQGATVVLMGDGFAKIVPEGDAKLQAGATHVTPGPIQLKGDQIASQIYRLNYESATNLVTILRPLISPNNTINANPGNNTLIITDYAGNLTRMGKIIAALDTPAGNDLDVIPVQYAIASDIAQMVNRLTESTAGSDGGRISVLADPRTNSVIVRAPSQARANFAKSLIAKLDQPTAQVGNVHVVYLKNADATKLAQTLRAVVSADTSSAASAGSTNGSSLSSQPSPAPGGLTGASGASQSGGPTGSLGGSSSQALSSGGAAGFIQADAATNTLIITASEPVFRNLRAVIDLLDARRAQVYIESLIVEVTSTRAAEFGIQWLGATGDATSNYRLGAVSASAQAGASGIGNVIAAGLGGASGASTGSTAAAAAAALPAGLSVGLFRQINGALGLGALVHALEGEGGVNILSTPNMLTLDNEEAKIIVGQNVPFTTGQFTTNTNNANPFSTIERKDVGLTLRVRPQISEGGTIRLGIFQETSSVVQSTATNPNGPTTNKRSIETNVLADDGQIIVLGGLIEDTANDNIDQVPGLGDIPILGNLFKYRKRDRSKTNLMVFLRPVVIRTAEESANLTANRYDYIRGAEIKGQPRQTSVLPNIGAAILPPLENGRLVGHSVIRDDDAKPAASPHK